MTQQPSQGQQPLGGHRLPGLLIALIQGLAYSVEVVFRSGIGERRCRQMALPLLLTLGAALLITLLHEGEKSRSAMRYPPPLSYQMPLGTPMPAAPVLFDDNGWHLGPYPMLVFCLLSVVRHVYQRSCAWRRRFQGGRPQHSYYDGTPNVFRNFRWFGLSEIQAKRWLEPAFILTLGISCVAMSITALGCYWIAAGLAVHLTVNARLHQEREQVLDSTDGVYDMMNHQAAVAAEYQPHESPPPAPRVVSSAPVPRRQPEPPAPSTPTIVATGAAVPERLREGLDDNLQQLLDQPFVEH